jgi:candicidin polyketide synthase FscB
MTNEDELRDYLELVAANLRRTRRCLREVEEKYAGPIAIVGMGKCALTTWRRGDRGGPVTADWLYRVTWTPAADSGSAALSGTWLLVAPRQKQFRDMVAQCAVAMAARGARVDTMLVDCAAVSWDVLAGLLEDALAGESLAGVVSFLGLGEAPLPEAPAGAAGLAGTLALVQALGDTGITVPLWVVTREAAAEDQGYSGHASGLTDPPAGFGARAATLLCPVLPGWEADQAAIRPAGRRRVRRRAKPAPAWSAPAWSAEAWSAEADRECLQAVNEAAGAPAQR